MEFLARQTLSLVVERRHLTMIALARNDRSTYDLLARRRARNRVVKGRARLFAYDGRFSHVITIAHAFD